MIALRGELRTGKRKHKPVPKRFQKLFALPVSKRFQIFAAPRFRNRYITEGQNGEQLSVRNSPERLFSKIGPQVSAMIAIFILPIYVNI
uniref:Uncharacterized protein n=1 Tax=Globodera rostochiensis TaxID=31243 RepID=A0A914I9P0_GLORO